MVSSKQNVRLHRKYTGLGWLGDVLCNPDISNALEYAMNVFVVPL